MLTQNLYSQSFDALYTIEIILILIYFISIITVVVLGIHYASSSGKKLIVKIVKGLATGATITGGAEAGLNMYDRFKGNKGNNGNNGNNSNDGNNGKNGNKGNSGNNGSNSSNSNK